MSRVVASRKVTAQNFNSRVEIVREGPPLNPDFDRYLTVDGRRAFHLGNRCDTCEFTFERLEGATDKVSVQEVGERLRAGTGGLDEDVIAAACAVIPPGAYYAALSEMRPSLTTPGDEDDYFCREQVDLWGIDSFWDLPHDPRVPYYRAGTRKLGEGRQLFEFLVPMFPGSWLMPATVEGYEQRLGRGDCPTALALAVLDIKQPAVWAGDPEITSHWCLAHFLLDGHQQGLRRPPHRPANPAPDTPLNRRERRPGN